MKKNINKKRVYFLGAYLFFLFILLFAAINCGIGIIISKALTIILFGMYVFKKDDEYRNNGSNKVDFEKLIIMSILLLFNVLMLFQKKMQGYNEIYNTICGIVLVLIIVIYFIQAFYIYKGVSIKNWIFKNGIILLIIAVFVLLSVEVIQSWLMWDSWQYYAYGSASIQEAVKRFNADFAGVYDLYLANHASLGYSLWVILFQLVQSGTMSVQIADITLAGVGIYAYYQILRKLLGKKYSDKILAILTIPYAFSPFVLGLVGNINMDSATMHFAIIFIALSLYQYDYLEIIFAFLLCFTKETAVVYYAVYLIAKIFCEYSFQNTFKIVGLLKYGFSNVKNYVYTFPLILWLALYKLNPNGGWNGETASGWNNEGWNCFGVSGYVIPIKLKQVFFLNFNWFFWLIIIAGIALLCVKKIKIESETAKNLIPIGIMGVSVIVVGCLYITFVLPRYIVPMIPGLYLVATSLFGCKCLNEKKMYYFTFLISFLLLLQSFTVIDPVMSSVFPMKMIGYGENSTIYKVGNEDRFDDHISYNRQNIYWSETIVEVLGRAGYDGNMLIVLPDLTVNSQYEFLGNWRCLWNTRTKMFEYYDESAEFPQGCTWVTTCSVSDTWDNIELIDSNYILYIVPKWENIDLDFISDKKVIKQGEVDHKGYNVQYMVLSIDYTPIANGSYKILPKQESSVGLSTEGVNLYLDENIATLNVCIDRARYRFVFSDYQVAMDVQYNRIDENGTVWVWEDHGGNSQRWFIKEVNGYYMICWSGYALTYDLNNNSVRLTPETSEENQLWSFSQ